MTKDIKIAKTAGFCFGVRRAISLTEKTVARNKKICTYGPLIHNPQEVSRLSRSGISPIRDTSKLKGRTLVLRTHGIPAQIRKELEYKNINMVDATCPFVKRAQDKVKNLARENYQIVIVGDETHPEVIALVSYGLGRCIVVKNASDLRKLKLSGKVGVVCQTTQSPANFTQVLESIRKKMPDAKIYNTICKATIARQTEVKSLAKKVDLMVVVGGKNSSNTKRLAEISRASTRTYHIEKASEIKKNWFNSKNTIGITAGASTPDWNIEKVKLTAHKMLLGKTYKKHTEEIECQKKKKC